MSTTSHASHLSDRISRFARSRMPRIGTILNVVEALYTIAAVVVLVARFPDAVGGFVFAVTPMVGVILMVGHEMQRRSYKRQLAALAESIQTSIPLIDTEPNDFDRHLNKKVNQLLGSSDRSELQAVGSLLSYARVFAMGEEVYPKLTHDQSIRNGVKRELDIAAKSLLAEDRMQTLHAIGRILAIILSIKHRGRARPFWDPVTSRSDFAYFLRSRACEIGQIRMGPATNLTYQAIRNFEGAVANELEPWAALILVWLHAKLYFLGQSPKAEIGHLFGSEYQVLAHDLLVIADAWAKDDWAKVLETISDDYRGKRLIPKFALRRGSAPHIS